MKNEIRYKGKHIDKLIKLVVDRACDVNSYDFFKFEILEIFIFGSALNKNLDNYGGLDLIVIVNEKKDYYAIEESRYMGIAMRADSINEAYNRGLIDYKFNLPTSIIGEISYDFNIAHKYLRKRNKGIFFANYKEVLNDLNDTTKILPIFNKKKGAIEKPRLICKKKALKKYEKFK